MNSSLREFVGCNKPEKTKTFYRIIWKFFVQKNKESTIFLGDIVCTFIVMGLKMSSICLTVYFLITPERSKIPCVRFSVKRSIGMFLFYTRAENFHAWSKGCVQPARIPSKILKNGSQKLEFPPEMATFDLQRNSCPAAYLQRWTFTPLTLTVGRLQLYLDILYLKFKISPGFLSQKP